jgi:hypothetical protein
MDVRLRPTHFNFQHVSVFPVTYGPETKPAAYPPDKIHFKQAKPRRGQCEDVRSEFKALAWVRFYDLPPAMMTEAVAKQLVGSLEIT